MPFCEKNSVLNRFEKYAKKAMREWHVPGMAIAIVHDGRLIYAKGFGVKKLGSPDPVNEKTIFQTGSITKSFTSALVSMLVQEGKLTWNDKVINHLPDFRLSDLQATRQFLVKDLMSQRSGLPPHSGRLLPFLGFDRNYIINSLRFIKPVADFRSEYAYQNNLFLVAAALVEKLTGRIWEENLSIRILRPLKMNNTSVTLKEYRATANASHGHYYTKPEACSCVVPLPMNWPHHEWLYTVAPAGGINSNVLDMARWLKVQMGQEPSKGRNLLSSKVIKFMHSPQTPAGQGAWGEIRHYCQGWLHSEYHPNPIIWHNGGTTGMKSITAMIPHAGIGIVILCNLYAPLFPEALTRVLFDLWFGKEPRDWSRQLLSVQKANARGLQEPDAPYTPPRPLRFYAGVYYNDLYGPVIVTKSGNSLALTLGPKKIRKKIKHWGGDTFVFIWPPVFTGGAGVQFYAGKSGIVDTISIEGLNDDLTGVFSRKPKRFIPTPASAPPGRPKNK